MPFTSLLASNVFSCRTLSWDVKVRMSGQIMGKNSLGRSDLRCRDKKRSWISCSSLYRVVISRVCAEFKARLRAQQADKYPSPESSGSFLTAELNLRTRSMCSPGA